MSQKSRITGPDMLRAVQRAAKQLQPGATLRVSPLDAGDLFKLTAEQLVSEFGVAPQAAKQTAATLAESDLSELSKLLGIDLAVDRSLKSSVVPNAGLIRSAGIWADNPHIAGSPDQIVESIRHMRTGSG